MTISRILAGVHQRLLSAAYRAGAQDTYILMLHEVTRGEQPQHPGLSITCDNLENLLDCAAEAGISIVPITDIHEVALARRAVLTFDDIFANACEIAFPLLRKRGVPYTVFITAEYIGKPNFVSQEQLEELKKDPLCTIGFHATSHRMMRELSDGQIVENTDPSAFEKVHGVRCEYFAFPYGSAYACPARAVKLVSRQGYRAVFSTIHSGCSSRGIHRNPWFIPRLCVSDSSWQEVFSKRK